MRTLHPLFGIAVLAVAACGGGGGSAPTAASTPAPTPQPTPTPEPWAFAPGQHLVGSQIGAGRYYADPRSGCYWERQSGLGGTIGDVIANEFLGFDAPQEIVDILPSDLAFEGDGDCGNWYDAPRRGFAADIEPGDWLAGSQVAPGVYQASVQSGCYWERLRNFEGTIGSILANDFVADAGPQLVEVRAGDVGFYTDDDCGTWTPAAAGVTAQGEVAQSVVEIEGNWRRNRAGWRR